jgi:hypothetical protein
MYHCREPALEAVAGRVRMIGCTRKGATPKVRVVGLRTGKLQKLGWASQRGQGGLRCAERVPLDC